MRSFLLQLGWEFRKLCGRRRTWMGFIACLLWPIGASLLLRIPEIRLHIQRDLWKMHWDFDQTFSGLTTAAHMLGEAMTALGTVALALVAADLLGQEIEDGTLRTILCRPVSRLRLYGLKVVVAIVYSIVLSFYASAAALLVGLAFEGRGPLVMIAVHEGIIGTFDFATGLQRYLLATAVMSISAFSGSLLAFAFSCFRMKPATAAALALGLFFADNIVRVTPSLLHISPYCLTTRMIAWRQIFHSEIPVERIQARYTELLCFDALVLVAGWMALRRRDFKP